MGDLISRAESVKRLLLCKQSRAKIVSRYDMGFVDGLSHAINILDLAPSADRPKGTWEIHYNYWNGEECRCSVCGYDVCQPTWNYCPKCGSHNDDVVEV